VHYPYDVMAITAPFARAPHRQHDRAEGGNGRVVNGADRPRTSVVLVDDSLEVRELVRRRLESSGMFEVVGEGADGEDAISLVHHHEPTLLLLDTSMPTMDGIEALPAILALSPETRVVMFTGFEEHGLAARARELGAADFIEKSIPLEELPSRLMRSLNRAPPLSSTGARHRLTVVGGDGDDEQRVVTQEQRVLTQHLGQFRDLFDQAAIGMATLTVNGTIVRANRALAKLMSTTPYDLVGVDYGQLTEGGGERLDRGLEAISFHGEDLTTFEHHLPTFPGVKPSRTVRVTLAPIRDSHGQVLYVFAQVQDISAQREAETDLRRSEETFRRLVAAVAEYAIFMLDTEGTVSSWNAGARRIKGYTADEIVGRSFRVFYLPEEQEAGHPEHNLEVALREGACVEDGWRVRKDGSQFWARVVISPVYDEAGSHIGFAKVTRDQTLAREVEEARKRAAGQEAHLLEVTAHELRTPTAVVDGSAATLRASWDELSVAERDDLLAGIRSSAHRLRRLASDLAMDSRLQGDAIAFRPDDVSLTQVVRSAAARSQAATPGLEIEVDVPDEVVLQADPGRLAQALDNLLDNATRHGSAPIAILGAAAPDEVHIRVSDAGPGVPPALVPRLFDRFAIGGRSGGTGLGLYLVREIARGHGGEVDYLPPGPGQQTAFEMTLPLRA
jgi:PAS domain S-box-containing protein